jgi:glutaredoxin 2
MKPRPDDFLKRIKEMTRAGRGLLEGKYTISRTVSKEDIQIFTDPVLLKCKRPLHLQWPFA